MDLEQNFQQQWEYRRKDDEVDSSTDDSKSSSGNEPDQKKHKLVSKLSLPEEEDEPIDNLSSQQNNQVDATQSVHFQIAEVAKKHLKPGKKKIAVDNKLKTDSGKTRKRKGRNAIQDQEAAPLNDLKIFTESLLKDIKVARKKMFVQMKKQMTKLVAAKPVSRPRRSSCLKKSSGAMHQTGNKSGTKTQSCYGGLKKGSRKDNMGFDSRECAKVNRERTNHEKAAFEFNRMDKREVQSLPGNQTLHLVKGSSSYLTLPTALLKPQTESLSIDPSLRDHIESVFPMNNANNAERENSVIDENNHYSYLIGIQPDKQFGSFAQITSEGMGFLDQQSTQISSVVSGIPVSLHPLPNSGFNITSQSALKNPAKENYTTCTRMNSGAVGFSGTSHTLSESFVANTISRNTTTITNTDTDGGLVSFRYGQAKGLVSFRYGQLKRDHLEHK